MPSTARDRMRRAILLLIIALPLLAGAIYVGIKPTFDATSRTPRVAIVTPDATTDSAPNRLEAELMTSGGFRWQTDDADSAAKRLSKGSLLAVVTIPEQFGSTGPAADPSARQVSVVPGRQDLDAATYAALVQDVTTSAGKVGVNNLLVGVSKAQGDLTNAKFTASIIRTAVGAAGDVATGAFGSVDALVKQAGPVLDNAKGMLATLQQLSGTVDQVGGMLATAGSSLHGVDLTLGDIQNGATAVGNSADSAAGALRSTATIRSQVRTVVAPIAAALQTLPGTQQMSDQLNSLLTLIGGPTDDRVAGQLRGVATGTKMIGSELNDLSSLLGAKVDAHTQLCDVLTLGANRIRTLSAFMSQGRQTINQVVGQVSAATAGLPGMEASLETQLNQFKAITAQLSGQLSESTSALPQTTGDATTTTADAISDPVQLGDGTAVPGGLSADSVSRAVLVLLVAALLIALARTWLIERLARRRTPAATIATVATIVLAIGAAGAGLAVLGSVPRADSAFVILAIAALALTALAVATLHILGDKAGIFAWIAIVGASAILSSGLHGEHNPAARFVARLLPGSYATTGLGDAAALGIGPGLALPIVVLAAVGILSIAAAAFLPPERPVQAID